MVCRLKEAHVTAVQWVPENADAIIEELKRGGLHADDIMVNGFDLILWSVGSWSWSVNPGQWIVIVMGRPLVIEADEIGEHLDIETPIG